MDDLDFFAVCPPGLERHLAAEVAELGFRRGKHEPNGVSLRGDLSELWRANLELRGATRILLRIGRFRATHFTQLETLARDFDWRAWLRPDIPVRVEAATHKSKLYHAGAVKQRFERAIEQSLGAQTGGDGLVTLKVRIDHDIVTLSLDSSGESLHKRGQKPFTGKAPIRETLAALILRACDYDGDEALVDPMCGSGTFLLEAAGRAAGLQPGRARTFAFQSFAQYDPGRFAALVRPGPARVPAPVFFGYDRDAGAIRGAGENAARAGLEDALHLACQPLSALCAPDTPPGLVLLNPPYGSRIGKPGALHALYGTLGKVLREGFAGWRVGIVTSDTGLARSTGLPLDASAPFDNGGIKVRLFQATIAR